MLIVLHWNLRLKDSSVTAFRIILATNKITIKIKEKVKVQKVKSASGLSGRSLSRFCSIKRLGILLLPPGWDASPSQGYPQH